MSEAKAGVSEWICTPCFETHRCTMLLSMRRIGFLADLFAGPLRGFSPKQGLASFKRNDRDKVYGPSMTDEASVVEQLHAKLVRYTEPGRELVLIADLHDRRIRGISDQLFIDERADQRPLWCEFIARPVASSPTPLKPPLGLYALKLDTAASAGVTQKNKVRIYSAVAKLARGPIVNSVTAVGRNLNARPVSPTTPWYPPNPVPHGDPG